MSSIVERKNNSTKTIDFHKSVLYTFIVTKTYKIYKCFFRRVVRKVKRITVELEDDFHKRVKMQAIMKDMSVKEYLRQLLEKDLETKKE